MKNNIGKQLKKLFKRVSSAEKNLSERIDSVQTVQNLILSQLLQNRGNFIQPGQPGSAPIPVPNEAFSAPEVVIPQRLEDFELPEGAVNEEHTEQSETELVFEENDDDPFVDVVMPLQEGRFIHSEVMKGLSNQCVKTRLWTSTLVSNGDFAAARNQVKQYARSKYVLMLDNDMVLPEGALERMIKFLDKHKDFGAVALSKRHTPNPALGEVEVAVHIDAGGTLWRNELYQKITYQFRGSCECMASCEDLRAMGYEIGMLTGTHAKHILDTRSDLLKNDQQMPTIS